MFVGLSWNYYKPQKSIKIPLQQFFDILSLLCSHLEKIKSEVFHTSSDLDFCWKRPIMQIYGESHDFFVDSFLLVFPMSNFTRFCWFFLRAKNGKWMKYLPGIFFWLKQSTVNHDNPNRSWINIEKILDLFLIKKKSRLLLLLLCKIWKIYYLFPAKEICDLMRPEIRYFLALMS